MCAATACAEQDVPYLIHVLEFKYAKMVDSAKKIAAMCQITFAIVHLGGLEKIVQSRWVLKNLSFGRKAVSTLHEHSIFTYLYI